MPTKFFKPTTPKPILFIYHHYKSQEILNYKDKI